MKRFYVTLFLAVSLLLTVTACHPDPVSQENAESEVTLTPSVQGMDREYTIIQLQVTCTEMNSKKNFEATLQQGKVTLRLPHGLYQVSAKGVLSCIHQGVQKEFAIEGSIFNLEIKEASYTKELLLHVKEPLPPEVGDIRSLVIAEIFPSGSPSATGRGYLGDQYFRIYNNSNQVVYADGLLILESSFNTIIKQTIEPNLTETCFPVQAVYQIPGDGQSVPIQPGGYLTICDQAINHKENNPQSIDLSGADFEWYDETPADSRIRDIDNPKVPNLNKIYCYTRTIWVLHNRGGSSYAIARMGASSAQEYLEKYKVPYVWHYTMPDGATKDIDRDTYIIPTDWIIDGVNLSIKSTMEWLVMPQSVDAGFTYVSTVDGDKERFGKAVIRKKGEVKNGVQMLIDTNNSTSDFDPQVPASLRQ